MTGATCHWEKQSCRSPWLVCIAYAQTHFGSDSRKKFKNSETYVILKYEMSKFQNRLENISHFLLSLSAYYQMNNPRTVERPGRVHILNLPTTIAPMASTTKPTTNHPGKYTRLTALHLLFVLWQRQNPVWGWQQQRRPHCAVPAQGWRR